MGEFLMWFGIGFVVVFIFQRMMVAGIERDMDRQATKVMLVCPSCGTAGIHDLATGPDYDCPHCGLLGTVTYE